MALITNCNDENIYLEYFYFYLITKQYAQLRKQKPVTTFYGNMFRKKS